MGSDKNQTFGKIDNVISNTKVCIFGQHQQIIADSYVKRMELKCKVAQHNN
jgi:hypothetical protein